jgi:hypothetical protein
MTDIQFIQNKIFEIRGVKVMFDFDLATLYQIETKVLKRTVRRNIKRFPPDFMFELNTIEWENLRSQNYTSSWGGVRYLPFAFTEQCIAMLSGILNSDVAIEVNISIMRTFITIRKLILSYKEKSEIEDLKSRIKSLEEVTEETLAAINDLSEDTRKEFDDVYIALSEMASKDKKNASNRNPIGFIQHDKNNP